MCPDVKRGLDSVQVNFEELNFYETLPPGQADHYNAEELGAYKIGQVAAYNALI